MTSPMPAYRRAPEPGGSVLLLSLLEDLGYPPALGGGQGPGLHQQHAVADAAGVGLVVRLVLLGTAQNLAVLGVLHVVLDLDDNRLVHLVADHEAFPALAVAPGLRGFAGGVLAHLPASSSSVAEPPVATATGASSPGSPESSTRVMIPSSRSRITDRK